MRLVFNVDEFRIVCLWSWITFRTTTSQISSQPGNSCVIQPGPASIAPTIGDGPALVPPQSLSSSFKLVVPTALGRRGASMAVPTRHRTPKRAYQVPTRCLIWSRKRFALIRDRGTICDDSLNHPDHLQRDSGRFTTGTFSGCRLYTATPSSCLAYPLCLNLQTLLVSNPRHGGRSCCDAIKSARSRTRLKKTYAFLKRSCPCHGVIPYSWVWPTYDFFPPNIETLESNISSESYRL